MKAFFPFFLFLFLPIALYAGEKNEAADPTLQAIRKVYVTGSKKHEVAWAKKRLGRYTCVQPVDSVEEADAILDLEPVEYHPPAEISGSGPITCTDKLGSQRSNLTCADSTGSGTRVQCRTAANGDTTCRSYYLDLAGAENLLTAAAERLSASASCHAYLLSKDDRKLLWDYDDSNHFTLWSKKLKQACGCGKNSEK